MLHHLSPATKWRQHIASGISPCLYPQLLRPKARNHVIIPQRSCLTTQPVVAQRTTGRFLTQPTQTLKGFHSSAVCRTPSAFIDNPTANPGCAARPRALLLKSFGLSFTPQKSKTLRVKVVGEDNGATGVEGLRYHDKARGSVIRQTIEMSKVLESLLVRSGFGPGLG